MQAMGWVSNDQDTGQLHERMIRYRQLKISARLLVLPVVLLAHIC